MITDLNKGISNINYNHLNLPTEIRWAANKKINYLYNAAGQKVKKTVLDGTTIKIDEYLDGFQYTGGILQFFPHPEGYVKATPGIATPTSPPTSYLYNYVYNYIDHLGNVRLSYTKDPLTNQLKIMDETHYYPFGLKHEVYVSGPKKDYRGNPDDNEPALINVTKTDYNYKYNGKEWQDELGLNMYDMDMRQYDPTIARWVVMDPIVHHSMSPYNSFDNNPVFWADPSGADAEGSDALGRRKFDDFGMYILPHQRGEAREVPQNKSKEKEEEERNDDIRFRDKNGNLIATYETDLYDDDVYLPIEITEGETNININYLMRLAGIDMDDIDIIGIGGSWDFAFVMGGSKAIEYVYFLDGINKGTWQSFIVGKGNVGINGSIGVYGIIGDYYNDKSLSFGDYTGTSFSLNIGVKGPWIGSYGKFWAPKSTIKDKLGLKSGFNADLRSWTGYTIGGGIGAGAQWSKQNTKIYNP